MELPRTTFRLTFLGEASDVALSTMPQLTRWCYGVKQKNRVNRVIKNKQWLCHLSLTGRHKSQPQCLKMLGNSLGELKSPSLQIKYLPSAG